MARTSKYKTPEEKKEALRQSSLRWSRKPESIARAQDRYLKQKGDGKLRKDTLAQYGLTEAGFAAMLSAQGGKCALCKDALPAGTKNSVIDHDHETGLVRGIIHRRCNSALGFFDDSKDKLRLAVEYLERSTCRP